MIYDCATALHSGEREYQQDSVMSDFCLGNPFGFTVLADGMGGHVAGDMASKIVLTEVFSELKLRSGDVESFEKDIALILRDVVRAANDCISAHVIETPDHRGMGSTILTTVVFEDRLYWVSVGDSPLFLIRGRKVQRLNEDHSMAPQIDAMVKTGQIDEEAAKNHPDRHSLMSVLIGSSIPKLECKSEPFKLMAGDIIISASDGLLSLDDKRFYKEVKRMRKRSAAEMAQSLIDAVMSMKVEKQDNISLSVLKVE